MLYEVEFIPCWLSTGPVTDNEETLHLLQSLEDASEHDSTDEIVVDTVEQQLECNDTEQDISTDEDDSGDVNSEQHTGKDGNTNCK